MQQVAPACAPLTISVHLIEMPDTLSECSPTSESSLALLDMTVLSTVSSEDFTTVMQNFMSQMAHLIAVLTAEARSIFPHIPLQYPFLTSLQTLNLHSPRIWASCLNTMCLNVIYSAIKTSKPPFNTWHECYKWVQHNAVYAGTIVLCYVLSC